MIERHDGCVLVQKRKLKYPGISFPGGHVEKGESILDCAIREVKEETGLDVEGLIPCGVVHWSHKTTDRRYMCFMYKTMSCSGHLIENNREGDNIWMHVDDLHQLSKDKFSSEPDIYALSPLLHKTGEFSETFIVHDNDTILDIHFK
jgi:8-oxo-dGTP diphosphatase